MDFFSALSDPSDAGSLFGGHFSDIFSSISGNNDSVEPPSPGFKLNLFNNEPSTPKISAPSPHIPPPKQRRIPISIADDAAYDQERPKSGFNDDSRFIQSRLSTDGEMIRGNQVYTDPRIQPQIPEGCVAPSEVIPLQFQSLFKYPYLTKVQSLSAPKILDNDDHVVIQAPTGSGKTALFEFAILRALMTHGLDFKAIYLVPIKALCSEKSGEWAKLFSTLKLNLLAINGDTDELRASELKKAHIIITTPEKFDSITRAFQDRTQFIQSINLLLVDEIHMLGEEIRGACIETVVTRMLTFSNSFHDAPIGKLRVVCASATIPNASDLAAWVKAENRLFFDNSYRPIPLKIITEAVQPKKNIFLTLKSMSSSLLNYLSKYSNNKQTIVFCATRALAVEAAKACTGKFKDSGVKTTSKELNMLLKSGVAYHHAGLGPGDRSAIEKGFLNHDIQVLCSTTTLALGVNLPAHLVIILGPYNYMHSDFEPIHPFRVLQMAGRAGRNGLDDSGVALIVHSNEHTHLFRGLENTSLPVESTLLSTLNDHLLSEIVCGTVASSSQSFDWIQRTFLYQRKKRTSPETDITSWARSEIEKSLATLFSLGAISEDKGMISATPIGHTICRFYIPIKVAEGWLSGMRSIDNIHDTLIECLNCSEFDDFPSRIHEREALNQLNKEVRYKYKLSIKTAQLKAQLLVQMVLGGFNLDETEVRFNGKLEMSRNSKDIMNSSRRLMACFFELSIHAGYPEVSAYALELMTALNSSFWAPEIPRSIVYLTLLNGVGRSTVTSLMNAGIQTVDDLAQYSTGQLSSLVPPATRGQETLNKILNVSKILPSPITDVKYQGSTLTFTVCGSNSCGLSVRDGWILLITQEDRIVLFKKLYPKEEFSDRLEVAQPFTFIFAHESLSGICYKEEFSVSSTQTQRKPKTSELDLLKEKEELFMGSPAPSFVDPAEFDKSYDFQASHSIMETPKLPPPARLLPSKSILNTDQLPSLNSTAPPPMVPHKIMFSQEPTQQAVSIPIHPKPLQSSRPSVQFDSIPKQPSRVEAFSLPSFLTNKDEFIECIAQAIKKSKSLELWENLE